MEISKELIDRLVCAKYIFQRGIESLERSITYADGLAVLHFQDAAEMCLRVIAEHLHCAIKENIAFNQILDEIDKSEKGILTHRTALNQLNKARLNFKHFGLQPKREDAVKFQRDLESFFPSAFGTFLGLNYDSLTLIDLVNHCRTRNHLKIAEQQVEAQHYDQSVQSSAVAFMLYRRYAGHRDRARSWSSLHLINRLRDRDLTGQLKDLIESIEQRFEQQQEQINLIMDGINLGDFRRFLMLTPKISRSAANTLHVSGHGSRSNATRDEASFCLRFVQDSILKMQEYLLPPDHSIAFPEKKYRVVQDTNVIVWPCEDPEVIRAAIAEELLPSYYEIYHQPGFIAIVQDDDIAFVNNNDVETVS